MSQTVLVADDSRTIRTIVEMALKAAPFEVVGVGTAGEAMEAAERSPSVILLDYHMAGQSGLDVCRSLKNGGATSQIPIIMLGGNHRDFNQEDARGAGADDVVMKPFDTDTLLGAIDSVADASVPDQAGQAAGTPVDELPEVDVEPAEPRQQAGRANGPVNRPNPTGPPPADGQTEQSPAPAGRSGASGSGSRRRIQVNEDSNPRRPSPPQSSGDSQPRLRTGAGQSPGHSDAGSQPRIPDSGSQATPSDSQPRISTPDVNASTRAEEVSNSGTAAPSGATNDSGVSNIGMSRAEIETMVQREVKQSVKQQLPGLLRNIMGDVFQKKVLPKLLDHGEQRVDAIVQNRLGEQIREAVRVEIERLLAEE